MPMTADWGSAHALLKKGYYVQGDISNPKGLTVYFVSGERKGNMWARPEQFTGWASLMYGEANSVDWEHHEDLPAGVVPPKPAKPNAR